MRLNVNGSDWVREWVLAKIVCECVCVCECVAVGCSGVWLCCACVSMWVGGWKQCSIVQANY